MMSKTNYKKYFMLSLTIIITIFSIYILSSKSIATKQLEGIDKFPASYQPYIEELAKKHPNWEFIPLYTGLDWNYVIEQENIFGKNLVPKNYSDSWKNTTPGQYNVEVDSGWVDSSKQAVEYCMDPRNFLNEVRLFQFEGLSYDANTNNIEGIEKILYGTEFYKKTVSYLDSNGNTINTNNTYSDLILKAGKTSLVSPYHLASRIKQEVGPFLTHASISGNVEGFNGLYNFYNIGATSSSEPMGAIKNGLQYAKDGKGASTETKNKYLIPWNSKEKAITGGAIFIGSSYINVGQNTIYLQKFDVIDKNGDGLFWHQYMTNVLAPYSESKSIYSGYQKIGMLDSAITFIIPIYNNMPDIPTQSPGINKTDFTQDNTKVYCTGSNVNIRTGPGTSYEIITSIPKETKMQRIGKGIQNGERWDKILLENGIVGYIYQAYVKEIPHVQIEKIDITIENKILQKGDSKQLQIKIFPEQAANNKVLYYSSNPDVAIIDEKGTIKAIKSGNSTITVKAEENNIQSQIEIEVYSKVTGVSLDQKELNMQVGDTFKIIGTVEPKDANIQEIIFSSTDSKVANVDEYGTVTALKEGKTTIVAFSKEDKNITAKCQITVVRKLTDDEIKFESPLVVKSLEISGIDYLKNTVEDIKEKIITNLEVQILNKNNELLNSKDLVGTGTKIQIKEDEEVLREYKVILYGDANGDGKINSVDLLLLQRHILEIEFIEEIYRKASIINKNANAPTSIDLLLIQRHILGLQLIKQ